MDNFYQLFMASCKNLVVDSIKGPEISSLPLFCHRLDATQPNTSFPAYNATKAELAVFAFVYLYHCPFQVPISARTPKILMTKITNPTKATIIVSRTTTSTN